MAADDVEHAAGAAWYDQSDGTVRVAGAGPANEAGGRKRGQRGSKKVTTSHLILRCCIATSDGLRVFAISYIGQFTLVSCTVQCINRAAIFFTI